LGNDLRPYEPAVSSSTEVTTVRAGTTGAESASDAQALDPAPQSLAPTRTPPVLNNSTASTASSLARGASQTTSTVQDLLADRRHKLEVDKREKEAAEKAERRSEAEARRKAMEVEPESAQAKQASYAQQQRKRQQEARLERERIMRHIKSDKQARKEKEELRKTLSKAAAEGNDGAGGLVDQQLSSEVAGFRSMSTDCALQVRLLDGSTIRSKFNPDQTLRTNVRAWIDEQRCDGDIPYTFKQILTPLPNRNITISEEDESLRLLGLTPSATLVMVPVQGYTAAYSGDPNLISRGLSAGYNVVSVGVIMVTRVLGKILGPAQGQTPSQEPAKPAQTTPVKSNPRAQGTGNEINVRTLHDQRVGPDDHQLYNGNQVCSSLSIRTLVACEVDVSLTLMQLNFEPRRDRDDEVD